MPKRGSFVKAIVVIASSVLLVGLAGASPAAAQTPAPTYSCGASALRVTLLGGTAIEPVIANRGESPCVDANEGLPFVAVPNPILPLVTLSALFSRTDVLCASDDPDPTKPPVPGKPETDNDHCDAGPPITQQVVSRGGAADVTINLGGLTIRARALDSTARAFCDPATNRPAFESDSTVVELTINGQVIEIPQNGEPFTLDLGLVRLALNERIGTEGVQPAGQISGSLTRRALHVSLPSNGSLADVVVGESKADYSGDVCPEGKIVVKKETAPDEDPNTTDFGFSTTGGLTPATFSLKDDGERVFNDVAPGSYSVTENAPSAPYSLDSIDCTDATGNTTTAVPNRKADINVAAGETVICTFTNKKALKGTIVVKKETTPDENPNATDFGFTSSGGLTPATFTLRDDGQRTFTDLTPGEFSVTENPSPTPYTLTVIDCTDPTNNTTTSLADRKASINVAAGETVTCTFVNNRGPSCPAGTVPDASGQCVAQSTECPAGTVKNPQGQCIATNVQCPPGTTLLPGVLRCEAAPTGGVIVPLYRLPGIGPCRDAKFGAQFAILGTNGPDRITGSNLSDRIFSLGGDDRVSGGRGDDCVQGGTGRDVLDGSNGNDFLLGESGGDQLSGGPGRDRLHGGSGNDKVRGDAGNDTVRGGTGRDEIRGGDGNDLLIGGAGNDGIHTGNGRDRVFAGSGNDIINAATRGPAAFVDCGPGAKDRVRINNNERTRTRHCEFVDVFKRIRRPH